MFLKNQMYILMAKRQYKPGDKPQHILSHYNHIICFVYEAKVVAE